MVLATVLILVGLLLAIQGWNKFFNDLQEMWDEIRPNRNAHFRPFEFVEHSLKGPSHLALLLGGVLLFSFALGMLTGLPTSIPLDL